MTSPAARRVFIGWSGDINIAADRVKETGGSTRLYTAANHGWFAVVHLGIPTDAPHLNNAYAFIDFYLRGDNSAAMANEMNYPTATAAWTASRRKSGQYHHLPQPGRHRSPDPHRRLLQRNLQHAQRYLQRVQARQVNRGLPNPERAALRICLDSPFT
jgi:hypothetical protein